MDASDSETQIAQTASADQQPQAQPQRSRTTVVCGECKRLKLKCDRQQPCAHCLRRNTEQKCVYSAGAVEKLDVHSLNHRLAHVEAYTMTYTLGRFQPAYASANHPSQAAHTTITAQQPSGWYHHHHHHHHAGILDNKTMAETFSNSFQSFIPTCLAELGLIQPPTSSIQGVIKLEPSLMDNAIPFFDQRSSPSDIGRMSKLELRQSLRAYHSDARNKLPSMTAYLLTTPSPESQHNVPQVTPSLLGCLPPIDTCRRLFQSAGDVFRVRPLPFDPSYTCGYGWRSLEKRCLQFLATVGTERKSRAVKRAREIYLGGPSQPNDSALLEVGRSVGYRSHPPIDDLEHSLTFFAITCAALAIGVVSSPGEGDGVLVPSSAAFFYCLSQQALGIWDTHLSSLSSKHSAKDDREQMEYLFACLLGVVYLLRSGTITVASADEVGDLQDDMDTGESQDDESELLSSLIGKTVTLARNMHLDKEATWTKRKKKKTSNRDRLRDEWKRMIWWEIVFYDLFIADALGQQPHISLGQNSTSFPACAIFSAPANSEGAKTPLETDSDSTDQVRVQDAAPTLLPHGQSTSRIPELQDEEAYLGARYQLARIGHAVKSRSTMTDCCCGYTLDQAVMLENLVREWQEALPAFLKVTEDDETSPLSTAAHSIPNPLPVESIVRRLQAYELAIVSNDLLVNVYMPFLRTDGDNDIKSRFKNLPAALVCIHSAQSMIHLVDRLQSLIPSFSKVMPVLFEFVPLEKLLFGAVVVCAHAAFAVKSPSMTFITATMADDASLGLNVLRKLGPPLLSSFIGRDSDDQFPRTILNILYTRLIQRSARLKRKLDEPIPGGDPQDVNQSVPAANRTLDHQTQQLSQDLPTQHTFVMDSLSSPSSTLESDNSGSQSPLTARGSNTRRKGVNKEKAKKAKKVEEGHPSIGYRLRDSKLVQPIPAQRSSPHPFQTAVEAWKQVPSTFSPSTDGQSKTAISPVGSSSDSYRSRSSSTGQVPLHPVDPSLHFVTPLTQSPDEIGMPPRKRPVLQDPRQMPPAQSTPFVVRAFEQGPHQTQLNPTYSQFMPTSGFDSHCSTAGTMDPTAYRYINTIPGPTTTPAYGSHLSLSSMAQPTYFSPTTYAPAFSDHLPTSKVVNLHTPASDTMTSIPNTPVYERPSQLPIENYPPPHSQVQQHQTQNYQMVSNAHGHLVSEQPQPSVAMYDCFMVNPPVSGLPGW